jgi:hypothetical protein
MLLLVAAHANVCRIWGRRLVMGKVNGQVGSVGSGTALTPISRLGIGIQPLIGSDVVFAAAEV